MGLAVVRCPACRGESQVDASALGLTVQCPRCDGTFVAIEEAEVIIPSRGTRNPTLPAPEPSRPRRRPSRYEPEPEQEIESKPSEDHDPHRHPAGPLPPSVLIGLALLPFAIPILWLLAPTIVGEPPVLSIATAVALAVSASALCLAVIYTIDWTPSTRIKGVLMLVALAYFSAISLYFLKKEIVDQVKKVTGTGEANDWRIFHAHPGDYEVKMPASRKAATEPQDQPFPKIIKLDLYQSLHPMPFLNKPYVFVVGSSLKQHPVRIKNNAPEAVAEWYDRVVDEIVRVSGGTLHEQRDVDQKGYKGRQVEIRFGEGEPVRFVRVFLIQGRAYYLSAKGMGLSPDEEPASVFFESFSVDGI